MRSFDKKVGKAYPRIYYYPRTLTVANMELLAVIIPGSEDRPHFAGPSYVRVGSASKVASEEQFDNLITSRNSKAREILRWRHKIISVDRMSVGSQIHTYGPVVSSDQLWVVDCNQFYVTLENKDRGYRNSIPLSRIEVSFDQKNDRLKLEERPGV
jgi:hypothetical protein